MIKVLQAQSWFDIAIMQTGLAENAYNIAFFNNYSVTDDPAGLEINIPDDVEKDERIKEIYEINNYKPATNHTAPAGVFTGVFNYTFN